MSLAYPCFISRVDSHPALSFYAMILMISRFYIRMMKTPARPGFMKLRSAFSHIHEYSPRWWWREARWITSPRYWNQWYASPRTWRSCDYGDAELKAPLNTAHGIAFTKHGKASKHKFRSYSCWRDRGARFIARWLTGNGHSPRQMNVFRASWSERPMIFRLGDRHW